MAGDLLRFTTAGSVDDGKSTLIGRLLLDCKAILEDQMAAIERASRNRGDPYLDLALLTDGLRAEREQGITIDVAYRYFATPRRKFIIADTPGHIQYTRNMVTGASTADLAVILIDARNGVVTQSKRHGFIASLLGIPHILVAVNKMDLVDYRQEVFEAIAAEYRAFASKLSVPDLTFIPISALRGDNVVESSPHMPWYDGPTLLHYLEHVHVGTGRNLVDFRFPVQMAIRSHPDFRGYAGQIASGTIMPGEEVIVLPSGQTSRVREIVVYGGTLAEAAAGDSVILRLADELDVSRGDMIVRRHNLPLVTDRLECTLCWMSEEPLRLGAPYIVQHTTRQVRGQITTLNYRIDVDTLHREPAATLQLNEIGRVTLETAQPLCCDPYAINRATGGFILIDPYTNNTVAAGMIRRAAQNGVVALQPPRPHSSDVAWEEATISRAAREARNGHAAAVLWFTGLSGSGKSTIARLLERRLFTLGVQTFRLDGDNVRHGLNGDLG
ncbi:MAG: sulfate adenylyltransferase subunit CysN, partial [Anaerolineae bacterium]